MLGHRQTLAHQWRLLIPKYGHLYPGIIEDTQ